MLLRNSDTGQYIQLDHHFHKELSWFNTFLRKYNGLPVFDNKRRGMDVYVNALLTGLDAQWLNNVYTGGIPDAFLMNYGIVHF